ncbi:MAG: DUF3576 domain-containing protein [Rhodospirillaceae bacterium]|nr:DUF3576 domain-containing protein [Rhodospirillaceae bacterium]
MRRSNIVVGMLVVFLMGLAAAGCENSGNLQAPRPDPVRGGPSKIQGKLFGEDGITLFRSGGRDEAPRSGIGVNAFLWRATLDTISFMPLLSADPFGGVIITDWYAPPESPDERFKLTVYILGRTLRADGVQVSVFRQERGGDGQWVDSTTNPDTAVSLEDKILERARQLRTAQLG